MSHRSIRQPGAVPRLAHILFCTLVMATASPLFAQQPAPAEEATSRFATAAVTVDGKTLFQVRGVSAFPAEERADRIRRRIIEVAKDASLDPAGIAVTEAEDRSTLTIGGEQIFAVVNADEAMEGVDRSLLAQVYRERIVKAIRDYRADRSPANLLRNGLFALGVTAIAALLFWALRLLFRWLDTWSEKHIRKGVQDLESKSHHLVQANAVWRLVGAALRLLRTVAYLVLAYFFLNTVLGLFPWTRPVARVLFRLVLDPLASLWHGFVASLPNLAFLVVLYIVVRYLLKLTRAFFKSIERGRIKPEKFDPDWAEPTFKIVRVLIVAFSLVLAYPYIPGSESAAFKGVSVFLGVLLSLGSSSIVANMVAGLSMTYRGAFKEGELIKVGDTMGTVEGIKLMVTRLRTPKNESIILPNSNIINTEVINYSQLAQEEGVVLNSIVGIGYDTPWRQVEALLLEAADRTEGLKKEPRPFVLQTLLGDFAVNYQINAYCGDANRMPAIYSALHANIQDVFNEYGVQIMSPAYETDPESLKIVPPSKWYEAPAKKPE